MAFDKPEVYKHDDNYSEDGLIEQGFKHYERRPKTSMVFFLTAMMTPMIIRTSWGEELIAEDATYVIVIHPLNPNESRPINELPRHPIRWEEFVRTYDMLNTPIDQLNQAEQSLAQQGCRPFYKFVGVWAKLITQHTIINGLEHGNEDKDVPIGNVLAIGVSGEPYDMPLESFVSLYECDEDDLRD